MEGPAMQAGGAAVWRIASFGDEIHAPSEPWSYDNSRRASEAMIVFQYVVHGEMAYEDAMGYRIVGSDEAALFIHGEPSWYGMPRDATSRLRTQWIGMRGAGLKEHASDLISQFGAVFQFGRDHAVRDAMRQLMGMADPRRASDMLVMAEQVHGFVLRLMRHGQRARQLHLTPVERAIDQLIRYPVSTWSLKDLARRHGVSREHVSRVFSERYRRSPGEYLAEKRVERAIELLEQTTLPLDAIAHQAGYGTAHAMARHVRIATGQPPGRYRDGLTSQTIQSRVQP